LLPSSLFTTNTGNNKQNAQKIAVRTHTCVTALDRHSRGTRRALVMALFFMLRRVRNCRRYYYYYYYYYYSQRPLYTGTNTCYASMHTNSV